VAETKAAVRRVIDALYLPAGGVIAQFACHDAIRTHVVFRTRARSAP
jgi:hypothetical protein